MMCVIYTTVPPSIIPKYTTQTLTVEQGYAANLTCQASGIPTPNVTWVRPNGMTLPSPNAGKFSLRSGMLLINSANETDRGVYRCIADNNVRPPDMYDVTLYVEFRPYARAVQTSYGQAQNRMFDVTLECRVSG